MAKLKCTNCEKVVPEDEYVELEATLIRGTQGIPLGIQVFCTKCWYEMQGKGEDD